MILRRLSRDKHYQSLSALEIEIQPRMKHGLAMEKVDRHPYALIH
jgi:hypothetical protein